MKCLWVNNKSYYNFICLVLRNLLKSNLQSASALSWILGWILVGVAKRILWIIPDLSRLLSPSLCELLQHRQRHYYLNQQPPWISSSHQFVEVQEFYFHVKRAFNSKWSVLAIVCVTGSFKIILYFPHTIECINLRKSSSHIFNCDTISA